MAYDANALRWTSADVLSDVRRRASLPTTSTDWTDAVVLREATDAIYSFAAWAAAQAGEGRFVASIDRAITAVLNGPYREGSELPLPALAIADTVENVTYIDQNGIVQSRLTRMDPAQEADFDRLDREGTPASYTVLSGRIRLYPRPTTGGIVRISYQRRHPELVSDVPANVAILTALTGTTTTALTLNAALTGLAVGDEVDVLAVSYPHRTLGAGLNVAAASGTSVTLSAPASLFTGLPTTGARLVRAGQSPYVQLPLELRQALVEKTTSNILRTMGDVQGAQLAEQAATLELSRVMQMLSPRAKRDKARAVNPWSLMRHRILRARW